MRQKKKIRLYKPVITILCAAAVLFILSTCAPEDEAFVMGSEARLTGLTIANVSLPASQIPSVIYENEWDDWGYELLNVDTKTMFFLRENDVTNVLIRPSTSRGARVYWGIGDRITRPNKFEFVGVPASIKAYDYIYIKVVSEDQETINYYRFDAVVYRSGTNLADVFIDGKRFNVDVEYGHPEWDRTEQGDIAITRTQAIGTKIRTVAFEDTSTFRFARVPVGSDAEPVFRERRTTQVQDGYIQIGGTEEAPEMAPNMVDYFMMEENFTDQDILYIEVTAENTVDKSFYQFKVSVGRIATIDKLFLINETKNITSEVMAKGVPNSAWGQARAGTFAVAHYDQAAAGFKVDIVLDDDEATIELKVISTPFSNPVIFDPPSTKAKFENKDMLAIKVTSQNGLGSNYYKVGVELLATKFLQQPKSAAYYYYHNENPTTPAADYKSPVPFTGDDQIPGKIKALDFILEVGDEGDYDYQWYESNSWYGGYGFDVNGKVTFSGGANTADEDGTEDGFIVDAYHTKEYDEKSNITLFNGGNQSARYVIPGRAINLANDATVSAVHNGRQIDAPLDPNYFNLAEGQTARYTPKINFRPFLPTYSNETHYYWVVITDKLSGYQLVSERATIVSERDNRKKHLIFDVNNYENPTTHEKIIFKNGPEPFKKKFEKFKIPLFFEPDFDINDYSYVTAQAKFYLVDGTKWVQNWTNGNLSFETDGAIDVLYYNLTNDNAAKSLASGGNESGAGLFGIPDFVVIEPSGDDKKGVNKDGYPLLGSNGEASSSIIGNNGNLQGWFCGFIELVEFRFEGPRR